jgi:hypothetical protein
MLFEYVLLLFDQSVVSIFNRILSQISLAHFIIVLLRSTFFCASVLQVGAADVNGFQQ